MHTLRTFAAAALLAAAVPLHAQTFATTTALPAAVADGGASCAAAGAPTDLTIPVTGITRPLAGLSVRIGLSATHAGDATVELIAPGGAPGMPLVSRIGANGALSPGDSSDFSGVYTFVDPSVSSNSIWSAAMGADGTTAIPAGTYYTSAPGGSSSATGAPVPLLATFSGLAPAQINGNWTLRVTDLCQRDDVTVHDVASLTLTQAPPPAGTAAVPTHSEWALALLALVCAALGLRRARRA
ncbi:MAG: IPTL-CTERM sorting domain-containing protein [Burkholderiaceae bacterium]